MIWSAIVPLKAPGGRKSRLAGFVDEAERARLGQCWFEHVVDVLGRIAEPVVLAAERPEGWAGDWRPDQGRGLNAEIQAVYDSLRPGPVAVFHADLPKLSEQDALALFAAAVRNGCAIAPDRHGTGTNGLAIADGRRFRFAFGAGSFARHRTEAAAGFEIVERPGLALDVDTPADLEAARDPR